MVLHFLKKIIIDNMLTVTGKIGEFFETIVQVAFYFPLDFCFFFHRIDIRTLQSVQGFFCTSTIVFFKIKHVVNIILENYYEGKIDQRDHAW